MAGVIDGFLSTWSDARATFGQGDPPAGTQYDRSGELRRAQSDLAAAAPGSSWRGAAADAYGKANDDHRRVIGQLASLDQRLSAQVDRSAALVTMGRRDLDAVRKWVVEAAASVPMDAAGQRMLVHIVNRGVGQLMDIVRKTNGEFGTIGGNVRGIGAYYAALGNQKFAKEGEGDLLGATGTRSGDDVEKDAKDDVEKTRGGDREAAGRVDEVLGGIVPYRPLSAEQAAYLHQMQVQQKDMSIQDIHGAERQLGDHQHVIGDSWQLMSNDDVKYDDPDHPGSQITGSRDQLPTHVKTMMSLGTIADDFNRTGESEVRGPYLADIAGVNGENKFPDLDNGNPERPAAKQLFAILGTDRTAYVEFNGAADQLGLDKAHAWAEDVKHGNPVNASDARMADAAVLKGLVAEGTAEGTRAMHLNADSALEMRRAAYEAGVVGLAAVGGPAVEIFGNAMASSVLDVPVGGEGGTPANISPDEASRYVANALLADGVSLEVNPQYMVDGHIASNEELNRLNRSQGPGTTLNETLSAALGPVLGSSDPSTSFQLWYNQTISGS